jgi:hypothetical protein
LTVSLTCLFGVGAELRLLAGDATGGRHGSRLGASTEIGSVAFVLVTTRGCPASGTIVSCAGPC